MLQKILPLLCLLILFSGCAGSAPAASAETAENSIDFFAMDTYMSIRAYGADDALLQQAQDCVEQLERENSTTLAQSAIHTLDQNGQAVLSEGSFALLSRALSLCEATHGTLDLSVYPIVRAWGFTTEDYRVPDADEIQALLEKVDYRRIALDPESRSVSLPEGMEIDLGAVTKGWTGDRLSELLRAGGVRSALLDLGGNIQAVGSKPDGSDWRIGIRDPEDDSVIGVVSVSDMAVVTSGGYERCFTDEEGNLWWHIMDPATGYPARNGLLSVTIVGSEGVYCDALSTALFIMGEEDAVAFWRANRDFEMALVTDDGRLVLSPGLAECFTPGQGFRYEWQVIDDAAD